MTAATMRLSGLKRASTGVPGGTWPPVGPRVGAGPVANGVGNVVVVVVDDSLVGGVVRVAREPPDDKQAPSSSTRTAMAESPTGGNTPRASRVPRASRWQTRKARPHAA